MKLTHNIISILPYKLSLRFKKVNQYEFNNLRDNNSILMHYDNYIVHRLETRDSEYDSVEIISNEDIELCSEHLEGLFKDKKFKVLSMGGVDTSRIESIKALFSDSEIGTLDLRGFSTAGIKDFSKLLYNSSIDKILGLEELDTNNAVDMSMMFYKKESGTFPLDIKNQLKSFNTSKVKNMQQMFYGCKMINADFSMFDTSSVEDMSGMFEFGIVEDGSFDVSHFNTSCCKNFSSMFCYMLGVRELDIRNFSFNSCSLYDSDYNIPHDLFIKSSYYRNNKSPLINMLNIKAIVYANKQLFKLIDAGWYKIYDSICELRVEGLNENDGNKLYINKDIIDMVPDGRGIAFRKVDRSKYNRILNRGISIEGLHYIGDDFCIVDNGVISTIVSYKEMKLYSNYDDRSNGVFSGREIKSIDFRGLDFSECTNLSGLFMLSVVDELDISSIDTHNVRHMDDMFSYLIVRNGSIKGLEHLDTSNVVSMNSMFASSEIFELNLSNFDVRHVEDMISFLANSKIDRVIGLGDFDVSNTVNMDYIFSNLGTVFDCNILRNWRTSSLLSADGMFSNTNLININAVNSLDTHLCISMDFMFEGVTCAEEFNFKLNVDNLEDCNKIFNYNDIIKVNLSEEAKSKISLEY